MSSIDENNNYPINNYKPGDLFIGYALIINQINFEEPTKIKDKFSNSHVIAGKLSAAFRHIGLEPVTYTDLSAEDLCNLCLDYSKRKILNGHNVFVMLVISHSAAGHIYCTDAALKLDVILKFFNEENCPQLKGKPKLFFIQAYCNHIVDSIQLFEYHNCSEQEWKQSENYIPLCQSSIRNHQPSPTVENNITADSAKVKNGEPLVKCKANGALKHEQILNKSQGIQLPAPESDCLIYYSTSKQKTISDQQIADEKADLSFCEHLNDGIRTFGWNSDFLDLLTLINGKLDEENKTKETIVKIFTYQFTKNLKFPDRKDDLKLPEH